MAYFKMDNWQGNMMVELDRRARQDPRYVAALEETFRQVTARIDAGELFTVAQLKAAGGWSKVVRDTFDLLIGDAEAPGSKLVPPVKLSALFVTYDQQSLRSRVQAHAAERFCRLRAVEESNSP